MWCELHLRYKKIISSPNVDKTAILKTEDMNNPSHMKVMLDTLNLPYGEIRIELPINTNISSGLGATLVTEADVRLFEKFISRVPDSVREKIGYLDKYEPWAALAN